MWILLSTLGALFQSITGAINKRNIDVSKRAINIIAFINYFFAGILLAVFFYFQTGQFLPEIKNHTNFWYGILITVPFNVIGAYFGYKALQVAEYNYVAPWLAFTSLFIVIPSYFLLGEIPSPLSFIGIIIVLSGAVMIDFRKRGKNLNTEEKNLIKNKNKAKLYMIVVGICYTLTPVGMKMAILESSAIFVAVVAHISIALTFLLIIIIFERKKVYDILGHLSDTDKKLFFVLALTAGAGYAIANGSINVALGEQQASLVMSVKRIAPMFSFFIGYLFLNETQDAKKKIFATILMVTGTILITLFK
jgi:drug/metabolite transporter (DMT)-like permease